MIDQIAKRIMVALERSAAQGWEVYFTESHDSSVKIKSGAIDTMTSSVDMGCGIRVLVDQRPGFFYTSRFTDETIAYACQAVIEIARASQRDPQVDFISVAEAGSPAALAIVDDQLGSISLETKVALAANAERAALAAHRAVTVDALTYEESLITERIINSKGVDLRQDATIVSFDASVLAATEDDEQLGLRIACGHHFHELDFDRVATEAALLAGRSLGAASIPSGRYDVVFSPAVCADLLEVLEDVFNAKAVLKGRSIISFDDLGKPWFSDVLTLIDDGRYEVGLGAGLFDGEGTPQQRTTLVESGVLRGLLCDRYYARELGCASSGNGQRESHRTRPAPGASNLFFLPGEAPPSALLAAMKTGLLITSLMSVDTADTTGGDFSLGASGFRVRDSAIAEPVAGVVIAGRLRDLFRAVQQVGNDLEFYGGYGGTSLLVTDLALVGQ